MSIASRLRNPKRPTANARREIRAHAINDHNRVDTLVTYRGENGRTQTRIESHPARFNLTPGHRDLGLIPNSRRHGQYLGIGGIIREKGTRGAFGGVTKAERKRRSAAVN